MSEPIALGANVGMAWVALRFSARGSARDIEKQINDEVEGSGGSGGVGAAAGKKIGDSISKSVAKTVGNSPAVKRIGETISKTVSGTSVGKKISEDISRGLNLDVALKRIRSFGSSVGRSFTDIRKLIGGRGTGGTGGLIGSFDNLLTSVGNFATMGPAFFNPLVGALAALAALMAGPLIASLGPIVVGFGLFAKIAQGAIGQVIAAVGQGNKAIKALPPDLQTLVPGIKTLQGQWRSLSKAVQPEIIQAFGAALKVIGKLMPALRPLIISAGAAFAKFLGNISDWLSSPSGVKFTNWLENQGPKDIARFGSVLFTITKVAGRTFSFLLNAGQHWWLNFKAMLGAFKAAGINLKNWLYNDFSLKIARFFTSTIPTAFDIFRNQVKLVFLKVELLGLKFVASITGILGHLPGPLGAPFREAHKAIGEQLAKIQADVANTADKINNDWAKLHGKKVTLDFGLNIPGGVALPHAGKHVIGAAAKGAKGARAGMWLVGEQGPEVAYLPQGTNVIPAGPSKRIMGGLASGTPGWNLRDVFKPSASAFGKELQSRFSSAVNAIISSVRANAKLNIPAGIGGSGGGPTGSAVSIGKAMAAAMGWTGPNWNALYQLWTRESGWRWNATNPTSGAYGIPQALPASKMASAGADWLTNPATQIRWGLGYLGGRYGSPLAALAHENAFNWYDNGGVARGLGFMPKNTPKPERVLSPTQTSSFERLVDAISGKATVPVMLPRKVQLDIGNSEMIVRDWAIQEARAEIKFAAR